jgi:hypothetical protein
MAEKTWQQYWLDNYNYKSPETQDLETYARTLVFGQKKGKPQTITYLPWAAAERPFKLQGGSIELVKTSDNSIVEVDEAVVGRDVDPQTGVVTERVVRSYFINVKATWLGQSYTERYPLMSASNEPLYSWSQNDLNKAVQRAKTKAIAIVSGIGYKFFEHTDLQFEEDGGELTPGKIATLEKKLAAPKSTPQPKETTKTPPPAPAKTAKETVDTPSPAVETAKETVDTSSPTVETAKETEFFKLPSDSEKVTESTQSAAAKESALNRVEMENEIKEIFLGAKQQDERNKLYNFLIQHKTTKISELNDRQLEELYKIMTE